MLSNMNISYSHSKPSMVHDLLRGQTLTGFILKYLFQQVTCAP